MIRSRIFLMAALVCFAAATSTAQAGSYSYAYQRINNFTVRLVDPNASATVTATATNGSTFAIVKDSPGGIDGDTASRDPRQAYVGPAGTAPPENSYSPKGMIDPDYARADALITAANSPFYLSGASPPLDAVIGENLAEIYVDMPMSNPGGDIGTGTGTWEITFDFSLSAESALEFSVNFLNDLVVAVFGDGGTAAASVAFSATVYCEELACVVAEFEPDELNYGLGLTGPGGDDESRNGTITAQSDILSAGSYRLVVTATEIATGTAVPEPGSIFLMGLGGLTVVAGAAIRRRRTRVGAA